MWPLCLKMCNVTFLRSSAFCTIFFPSKDTLYVMLPYHTTADKHDKVKSIFSRSFHAYYRCFLVVLMCISVVLSN